MGIENLLAQGYRSNIEPLSNVLMRQQQMQDAKQRNALMQMQIQGAQEQAAERQQNALMQQQADMRRRQYLDSVSPAMGPAMPVDPAAALLAGVKPQEVDALRGPKPAGLMNVGPGGAIFDPTTRQEVYRADFKPTPQKLPPVGELQQYRETLPAGDPRRREVDAVIANQTRAPKYATPGAGPAAATPKPAKPLPPGALKMQQESLDKIGISASINADLDGIAKQIDSGKLSFGPVSNLLNTGRNMAGMSSEQSRNFGTFKSTLERLRNESLRLNTGVQTDGDAQRAWNELFQNINDTGLVKQRLIEIQAINKRGADLQRLRVDSIRNEYGAEPLDASGYEKQPAAVGTAGAYGDSEKERRYQEWKARQK